MTNDHDGNDKLDNVDKIDEEAAEIDARDPDAAEEIAELVDGDPAAAAPPPVDVEGADS